MAKKAATASPKKRRKSTKAKPIDRYYDFHDLIDAFVSEAPKSAAPAKGKPPSLYQALCAVFDVDFGAATANKRNVPNRLQDREWAFVYLHMFRKSAENCRTLRTVRVPWSGFVEVPEEVLTLLTAHENGINDCGREIRKVYRDFLYDTALRLYPELADKSATSEDLGVLGYEEPPPPDDDDCF